jgi:hypothetical protein
MRARMLAAMLAAAAPAADAQTLEALILDPDVSEISGMTQSLRRDDLLWVVNDSHNPNRIHAVRRDGRVLAGYTVEGATNVDWEDLTAFELDGKRYLAIADTGDNGGVRRYIELIVIEEPLVRKGGFRGSVRPAWRIRIRWPDGPRDCEAVAVDTARRELLLMSKKRVPAQLFRVPLAPTSDKRGVLAEQVAVAGTIPQPDRGELDTHPQSGRYRAHVTSMALAPNGRDLVVLTYRDAYRFVREGDEPWSATLARKPQALGMPPLLQAESLTFSRDGREVWITSEKLPAPLVKVPLS